jgi:undecaprenyl-diphosphatase
VRRWRARLFQGYVVAAILGFAVLFGLAKTFPYFTIDLMLTRGLQSITAPWFAGLMWLISWPGYMPQSIVILLVMVLGIWALRARWVAVCALLAAVGAWAVGDVVKFIVQRPRPTADLVQIAQHLNSYSFPSGHVTQYTALCGFLLFLTFAILKPSFGRGLLVVLLGLLILLIGPSRMYLGAHWASDVVGGYLLGSLWLIVTVWVYRWGGPRFFKSDEPH